MDVDVGYGSDVASDWEREGARRRRAIGFGWMDGAWMVGDGVSLSAVNMGWIEMGKGSLERGWIWQ